MNKKDIDLKKSERFNRKKILSKLEELNDTITGRGLELTRFTGLSSSTGQFFYNEDSTREFIVELINLILHYDRIEFLRALGIYRYSEDYGDDPAEDPYRTEKYFLNLQADDCKAALKKFFYDPDTDGSEKALPKGTDENEIIFFKSLLYCCIRIALYEDKKNKAQGNDFKPATLKSLLESIRSLKYVYDNPLYEAYEASLEDAGADADPRECILLHTYNRYNSSSSELVNYFNLELRSIFDKINLYYLYLNKGRIPAACDIEGYKETDPAHYKLLKKRKKALAKERELAEKSQAAEDKFAASLTEEETDEMEAIEAAQDYMDSIAAGTYDADDEYAARLREEMLQNADNDLPGNSYDEPVEHTPDFDSYSDFEEPERFIKECELFRFYLNAPGYPKYNEKAGYAIDKYISENDLCGFSDIDGSIYIYQLLSNVRDVAIKKMEGK